MSGQGMAVSRGRRMRKPPGRNFLRAGAVFGALLVAASIVGPPPSVRADVPCRDQDGFWCLYGKNFLEDGGGLIGTNNGDTDLKMDGDWGFFNDRTRSVSNRSGSFLGLYDDINFKGLMACLPPHSSMGRIGAGVSSLRVHPTSGEACVRAGGAGRPKPKKSEPVVEPTPEKTPAQSVRPKNTAKPDASPTLPLPSLAPQLPTAPPVDASATKPAAGRSDGIGWTAPVAIAGSLVTILALGFGGLLLGRRRRAAVPLPRTATDPGAALRVHNALLLLAIDCEQERRDVPKVRAVTIDDAEVVLHLSAADGKAPQPWRVAPGGTRWHLPVTGIDELSGNVDPATAPYPLLAALRPGMWANLAALPGSIALTGHRNAARKAAVEMARRLREDPWHGSVRVRMMGFAPEATIEPEAGTERGRVVFIDDGMEVPDRPPPGSVVVSVGRPERAGTIWHVRSNGTIAVPADLLAKGPATDSGTDHSAPADAGASADGGE